MSPCWKFLGGQKKAAVIVLSKLGVVTLVVDTESGKETDGLGAFFHLFKKSYYRAMFHYTFMCGVETRKPYSLMISIFSLNRQSR